MLAVANLRLHTIISNRPAVIEAFHPEDRAVDIKDVDLFLEDTPVQRSLGVSWNIVSDTFTFQAVDDKKPFTRRGVLSTVNWYSPLPDNIKPEWIRWRKYLQSLQDLKIQLTYSSFPASVKRAVYICRCICDSCCNSSLF